MNSWKNRGIRYSLIKRLGASEEHIPRKLHIQTCGYGCVVPRSDIVQPGTVFHEVIVATHLSQRRPHLCLLVAPASHGAGETGAGAIGEGQATETSADQALAARIQEALAKEPVLRDATNLSVVAREGEVTLSGSVGNTAQAERAVQVARSVKGVQRVEDKLVRESKLDVPATPHQSTVIDAPMDDNAETGKPRAK